MESKICHITGGDSIHADSFTYDEACNIACEETEVTVGVLAIVVYRYGKRYPVAFSMDGTTYPILDIECPRCGGSKYIVTGWDDYLYENIEECCPHCQGTGSMDTSQLLEVLEKENVVNINQSESGNGAT
jgi:DnaJ-class molecular chaperone